jgi:predicted oxidoreductase
MKYLNIGGSELKTSAISLGCMRIHEMEKNEISHLINTALDSGINLFDHADIYGGGKSEEVFAQAIGMNSSVREKMIIQSKCGIRKGMFDFSKEHILQSVDGILQRLQTDYIDVLLLHRPDTLMEPEEIAEAFTILEDAGKVRHFGVSNQNPMQIELLNKYIKQPIIANQLQLSITNTGMIDAGFNVNMTNPPSVNRDGSVLDYCRLKDITIQAWSPFQYGFFEGTFIDNEKFPELNGVLDRIAGEKAMSKIGLAIAWILRHPAKMQAVIGTTNSTRVADIAKAADVELSREEWYEIYRAAGNQLP